MCDKQPTPALPWTNKSAKSALALPQLRLFFGDGADALDSPHMSYAPKLLPQVPFGGAERAAVPARDVRGGFRWFVPQAALDFPGIAHVDGTARVQTCAQHDNPWLHALLVAVEVCVGVCEAVPVPVPVPDSVGGIVTLLVPVPVPVGVCEGSGTANASQHAPLTTMPQ